jgi:hypothetical protein
MRYGAQRWRGMGSRRKLCAHSSQQADETAMALLGTPDATRRSGFVSAGHGLGIEHGELAMRMHVRMFGIVLCALAAAACGGDEGSGPAGTGGTAGSGGTAGGGGTVGGQTSTVNGVVVTLSDTETVVEGAMVSVFGQPISATTNASGQFTLLKVPNGEVFFIVEAATTYWGSVDYYDVPGETGNLALYVVPVSDMEDMADTLGRTYSDTDGAVDIWFYDGAQGGESGTIMATPSDAPFTFTALGIPTEQDTIIATAGEGDLIFTSVKTADGPIRADVTGVPGEICYVDESPGTTYPIRAKSITTVYAYCEPAR